MIDSTSALALDKPAPPKAYRWTVLVLISFAMFGNYYVYDSISPLADVLKAQLGFSDANIGLLNAIYSIPNVFMVLIGGIHHRPHRHPQVDDAVRRPVPGRRRDHGGVAARSP